MAILTPNDLEIFLGKTFTNAQEDAAQTIIASLEAELSYFLNRPLGAVVYSDELHRLERNQRQIFLRHAPVHEVTEISIGLAGEEVEQNVAHFDVYSWGIDNVRIAGQGYRALITYTAGMTSDDTVALERVLYSASSREMGKFLIDAQGLERLRVEGTEYRFLDSGEGGFTQAELNSVKRFRRRVLL